MRSERKRHRGLKKITIGDIVIAAFLIICGLLVLIPFYNVIIISLSTEKEYLTNPLMLFPRNPTLASYKELFRDGRILIGYRTTLIIVGIALPLSLFCTTCFAYGMSRKNYPGRAFIFYFVLFTMLFSGGIIPLYMLMKGLHLTNSISSVILASLINTFYMILMRSFFTSIPEALIESAKLDGASEWKILITIVLPLSTPIISTIALFIAVDRWNEWYNAMIFIQRGDIQPLQLVLRSIVVDSQVDKFMSESGSMVMDRLNFTMGLKTAAIICTMLPIMCVYPFVQKHFTKGIMLGAVKQ